LIANEIAEYVEGIHANIARYVQFYNHERPHKSLGGAKPDQFYAHSSEKIAS